MGRVQRKFAYQAKRVCLHTYNALSQVCFDSADVYEAKIHWAPVEKTLNSFNCTRRAREIILMAPSFARARDARAGECVGGCREHDWLIQGPSLYHESHDM